MQVELVSPERVLFSGEATQVITRTLGGGEIAFLPGHAPVPRRARPRTTRASPWPTASQLDVAVHGGFVQVSGNKVSILSDIAELADDIDRGRAMAAMERAEAALRHAHDAEAEAALEPGSRPPQRHRWPARHLCQRPLTHAAAVSDDRERSVAAS